MAEDDIQDEKGPRFRSPPYPAISLGKAIDRAARLFSKAQHYPAGINVIADAWQQSAQSGGLLKYAAALIQYGLLADSGTGGGRKFQVTDIARRIIQDTDPNSEKRAKAIQTAALSPMIHRELWEKFGSAHNISDAIIKNHLILDRVDDGSSPYSDAAAAEVIQNFREAVSFSGLVDQNSPEQELEGGGVTPVDEAAESKKSISGQAYKGETDSKPVKIDDDLQNLASKSPAFSSSRDKEIKVMLDGDILRVSAVVDARGIRKLIKVLNANLVLIEDEN